MKNSFRILLILIALISFPATAFMSWGPSYEGEPDLLNPGHITGTFLWHDNSGFHLRTTTTGDKHIFTGTIHTNGRFKDISDRFFRVSDYYHQNDQDTIDFQFTTEGRSVGLDWDMLDGDFMAVELYMDGNKISPLSIYIGHDSWHPNGYKFTLDRQPYYSDDQRSVIFVHPHLGLGWGWGYHHW